MSPYQKKTVVAPPRRRRYAVLLALGVMAALFFSVRETRLAGEARRNIPPPCILMLAEMPVADAHARGVPLRDCRNRRMMAQHEAQLLGRWSYGVASAPVTGHIALVRKSKGDHTNDRLMHIEVRENHLMLNELSLEGTGCGGGIADAYVKGDSFGMVINLTPEALVRFTRNEAVERGYQEGDLDTGVNACSARLTLVDRRPVMIQLNEATQTAKGAVSATDRPVVPPRRQACFNELVARRVRDSKTTLKFPDEYQKFVASYVANCAPVPPARAVAPVPSEKRK